MPETDLYADLILPVPLNQVFTYHVPEDLAEFCTVGKRAVVQFGKRKVYSGIIYRVHENKPTAYQTKDLLSILDDEPLINDRQLKFWKWIADYYLCSLGEVYRAALPSGLKLESQTGIRYNFDFFEDDENLERVNFTEKETLLLDVLRKKKTLKISEVNKILTLKNSLAYIKSLYDKGAIEIDETIVSAYRNKQERYIRLHERIENEDILNIELDNLKRAKKQKQLLFDFLKLINYGEKNQIAEIKKKELLAQTGASNQVLNELLKKEILESFKKNISRLAVDNEELIDAKILNKAQATALREIKKQFKEKNTVLLHGITSSGKTEIYIHLIHEIIKQGKQVLYLLPEIALSTQLIIRLKKHFGDKIGVYHSKFNDAERVEIWKNIQKRSELHNRPNYQIILGVRSSVFLPFENLGLIIIDEEHENTFKQYHPAPRYHARDSALVLAQIHGAKTLLGTATPSIESYYNAQNGKFGFVELKTRYQDILLPEIFIADTKEARRKKQMKSHFTPLLLDSIQEALAENTKVILFQNRRGFAPYLECTACGEIPKCKNCDVSLTYHRHTNQLTCHYCGYSYTNTGECAACGSSAIRTRGFGTEKVEDELAIMLPHAKIRRMDLDSTQGKRAHERLIQEFETGQIDILIGTQMVTKGLDFDDVSLVGILDADQMLNFPDFRAYERSFQLMAQVSGRAGRKNKRGKVIIQTSQPENLIIKYVIKNDYLGMYFSQIAEREMFKYPPYNRLIYITLKHKDKAVLDAGAKVFADWLRRIQPNNILGPEYPVINRTHNLYLKSIIVKLGKGEKSRSFKKNAVYLAKKLVEHQQFKSLQIVFDVDPQ